jgi:hypothetical protein
MAKRITARATEQKAAATSRDARPPATVDSNQLAMTKLLHRLVAEPHQLVTEDEYAILGARVAFYRESPLQIDPRFAKQYPFREKIWRRARINEAYEYNRISRESAGEHAETMGGINEAARQTIHANPAPEIKAVADDGLASESTVGSGSRSLTGFLGGADLAEALNIDPTRRQAFFRQLERQRLHLGDNCWHEVRDPRPNSPRFLYLVDSPKLRYLAAGYKTPQSA